MSRSALLIACLCVAIVSSPFVQCGATSSDGTTLTSGSGGWTQAGGPLSKTGFVTSGTIPTAGADVVWKYPVVHATGTTVLSSPDGTRSYVGYSTGTVKCIAAAVASTSQRKFYLEQLYVLAPAPYTLNTHWTYETQSSITTTPALTDDGTALIVATQNTVHSIDTTTGKDMWTPLSIKGAAGASSDVTVYKGMAFVGTESGELVVLNVTTGAQLGALYASSQIRGSVSIDVATSQLFYTSQDKSVYAATVSTTAPHVNPAWSKQVTPSGLITTTPVVGVSSNALFITPKGAAGSTAPLMRVSTDGVHTATKLQASSSNTASSPVLASDTRVLFADSNGGLFCVNANATGDGAGSLFWSKNMGGAAGHAGITDGNTVVFGTHSGALVAYSVSDGSQLWKVTTAAGIAASPSFNNGLVVAVDTDGTVYAIGGHDIPVWANVIIGAAMAFGLVVMTVGYRFFRVTLAALGFAGFFPIVLVFVQYFSHLKAWENVLVSAGASLVLAVTLALLRASGPAYFGLLFAIFVVNDVLIILNITYESLGYALIGIELGSVVVLIAISFVKNLKKAISILGIAAVGATIVVDGALWFTTLATTQRVEELYLGIAFGAAFVLSVIIQAITGRGQYHLSKSDQKRYEDDEALRRMAAADEAATSYAPLPGADGGAGASGTNIGGDTGYGRKSSGAVFADGGRFRGDEFDMGPSFAGNTGGHTSVAVLPGERAMAHDDVPDAEQGGAGRSFVATFQAGKLGMGLTVPHNPAYSPSCAVVKRVAPRGQADRAGVRVGDFVVRVGTTPTPTSVPYDMVMAMLKPPSVQYPLKIEFLRVGSSPMGVDMLESRQDGQQGGRRSGSGGLGNLLGGW